MNTMGSPFLEQWCTSDIINKGVLCSQSIQSKHHRFGSHNIYTNWYCATQTNYYESTSKIHKHYLAHEPF